MLKAQALSTGSLEATMKSVVVFCLFGLALGIDMPRSCNNPVTFSSDQLVNVVHEGNQNKMVYYMNLDLKLVSHQDAACFKVQDHNSTFAIYLKNIKEYCTDKQFMYAVPRQVRASCSDINKDNWFYNNYFECKGYTLNSTTALRIHNPNYQTVLDYGCYKSHRTFSDDLYWWAAVLTNHEVTDFYKVYKCTKHQRLMNIVVVHKLGTTGNVVEDSLWIKEGEQFVYKLDDLVFKFDDLSTTTDLFFNFGNTCYVTDALSKPVALLTRCNDKSTLTQGLMGEVRCDIHRGRVSVINAGSCKVAPSILQVTLMDYGVYNCKLAAINIEEVINSHRLPYHPTDLTEVYDEGGSMVISRSDSAMVINVKSTVHLVKQRHVSTCSIKTSPMYDFMNFIYNTTIPIDIQIQTTYSSLVTVTCDQQKALFNPLYYNSSNPQNQTLFFVPIFKNILTSCKVLCDGAWKADFQLRGIFLKFDEAADFSAFQNVVPPDDVSHTSEASNFFEAAYKYISDGLSTIWGKIVGAVSTLIITGFIIIGVLVCLGRIPCCRICIGLCKAKKTSDDLNNVRVISNKIKKNTNHKKAEEEVVIEMDDLAEISESSNLVSKTLFYAYNGEPIEIVDEDYSIKPTGIYHKHTLIVNSIPHVIFYDKQFVYKDNKIFRGNQVIVDKVSTSKHVNSKYILDDGIIYDFDNYGKPLIMLRNSNLSDMQILDDDYTEFDDSLYLHGHPVIKNIFLDL